MKFRLREAPEWFYTHVLNYYTKDLHTLQKAAETITDYTDQQFKEVAVEYFARKGFTVWLDADNHIWFDLDPDSAKWTWEILRN